jgi:uncharacterized protein (TIGR02284 family)
MKKNEKVIEALNDLILINNDRITGYEKAAHQSKDLEPDIKNIFHHMASESRKYVSDLHHEVLTLGGRPASGTTTSGKLYRAWIDLKATFTGPDSQALLMSCEEGEAAAQKAYIQVLGPGNQLPGNIFSLLQKQQLALKSSHELIKRYRNTKTFSRQ